MEYYLAVAAQMVALLRDRPPICSAFRTASTARRSIRSAFPQSIPTTSRRAR